MIEEPVGCDSSKVWVSIVILLWQLAIRAEWVWWCNGGRGTCGRIVWRALLGHDSLLGRWSILGLCSGINSGVCGKIECRWGHILVLQLVVVKNRVCATCMSCNIVVLWVDLTIWTVVWVGGTLALPRFDGWGEVAGQAN